MANTAKETQDELDAVQPYSMHVSSRYLELTQKKLQLTRLPRELELLEHRRWELGTPKALLEPLLDYWLESYDWRTQEAHYNSSLPQYRTTVEIAGESTNPETPPNSLRIHFVHKRSKHANAIPLLFCHTWPSSFIEVSKIIDALTDPHSLPSFGAGAQQAFHVVAPSIPGFGFSDSSSLEEFGLRDTADVFNGLMKRLGYDHYVAHGTGWGFSICRALAVSHSDHCLAIHTANPLFDEPTLSRNPMVYLKHRIACWTKAKMSFLNFGYTPAEVVQDVKGPGDVGALGNSTQNGRPPATSLSPLYALRPQTLAFSLCDSPVGLLAGLLDVIHTRSPPLSPVTSRSRSPFLSPVELEMQESHHGRTRSDEIRSDSTERPAQPLSPRDTEHSSRVYTWSPTEVLNWTMLQWLPGPEASLRWLRRATLETLPDTTLSTTYCNVPLGISSFNARSSSSSSSSSNNNTWTPLMWGSATWQIAWVKRHQRPASLPAWEAPDLLVLDVRECMGSLLAQGRVNLPSSETG